MSEPKRITVGNSYRWEKTLSGFSSSDGWELGYSIVNQRNQYSITSTGNDELFEIVLSTSQTLSFTEGEYKLIGFISKGEERKTIYAERLFVRPNFEKIADLRTFAEKTLDAIEAMIQNSASKDQQSITVDGQTLARRTAADLILLRDRFKREVARQKHLVKQRKKGRKGGRIQVRFK